MEKIAEKHESGTENEGSIISEQNQLKNMEEYHKPEDPIELQQKIFSLREEIEKRIEKIDAKKNSQEIYGYNVPFSTIVDGKDSTFEMVEEERKKLKIMEDRMKIINQSKKRDFFRSIRTFLNF